MNPAYLSTILWMLVSVLSLRGLSSLVGSWLRDEAPAEVTEATRALTTPANPVSLARIDDVAGRWS